MSDVLLALAYCHSKQIVHRDIRPQKLIYESKEPGARLKLTDFALAQPFKAGEKISAKVGSVLFAAPEVLRHSYNEKCDVWSCGIILYILLCGYAPFTGHNHEELRSRIKHAEYKMIGEEWDAISSEGKDLVKNMLLADPDKRCTAAQAASHEWIQKYGKETVDVQMAKSILGSLQLFNAKCKLQQAALSLIVSQHTTNSEKNGLTQVFNSLDTSGRGRLSKEDIIAGYKKICGDSYPGDEELSKLIDRLDVDKSGFIDYTEFAAATISRKTILSRDRLVAAFKTLDKVLGIARVCRMAAAVCP